jgi:hypothetical protein
MSAVILICRFVARTGAEGQLKALLLDILALTRSEPECKVYDLCESDLGNVFFSTKRGKLMLRSINIWRRTTLSAWSKTGGRLVKEPFEINFVKQFLTGAAEV